MREVKAVAQPKTVTKIRKRLNPTTGETISVIAERTTTTAAGNVSEQSRRAGAANLAKWRAEQAANPDKTTEAAVAQFRAAFARDLGDTPTVSEIVLLEGATATFVALRLCIAKLKRTRNSFDETLRLTHEIATLQKQLLKTTATLTEMRKASVAPPTIADLILQSKRARSGDDDVELEEPESQESPEPEPAA